MRISILHGLPLIALLPACSSDPGNGQVTGDPLDFMGIRLGASWTYRNTNYDASGTPTEDTLTKGIASACEMISFSDCDTGDTRQYNAYVHTTQGANAASEDADKLYMVSLPEVGVVRVKQDFIAASVLEKYTTYSPYFMRLPVGPYETGQTWEDTHLRCKFLADDTPDGEATRRYHLEVMGVDEDVQPEGGDSYSGALHIKRTDQDDNSYKEWWFVSGTGAVLQEIYDGSGAHVGREALSDFTAGTGTCE